MKTIHLIFNAHIDPVWLWPWQAGLDEVLATCRSACELLERHPDLTFSRGEAWVYQQVERMDPQLFQRIRRLVESGRWEIVGGWWIQPDCNLPSGWGFEKQIELGRRYFMDRFGIFPRIGWNVDSFGHTAALPRIMNHLGQDRYVFMRPGPGEMILPARTFRWRGDKAEPQLTTFRIAGAYTARTPDLKHLQASLTDLPNGIDHTMCFLGVGDHGGGPTEKQIAWCREHMNAIEGAKIIFSTPSRFFDAIEAQKDRLPVVTGELQFHAIGCYTVVRPMKLAARRAEHLARQAELLIGRQPAEEPQSQIEPQLNQAWQDICFNHFHDTLGGSSIPSAYVQALEQLGRASATADEILQVETRRRMLALPPDELQRIILLNASDEPFDGYTHHEPWLEWRQWSDEWELLDESGDAVPCQRILGEPLTGASVRLVFRVKMQPGQMRVLRINPAKRAAARAGAAAPPFKATIDPAAGQLVLDQQRLPMPLLHVIDDPSDTWSHGIDRYAEEALGQINWSGFEQLEDGPLYRAWLSHGRWNDTRAEAQWITYAGEPFLELRLRIGWLERRRLLKMLWQPGAAITGRIDGIAGGELARPADGAERPLRDFALLQLSGGATAGVVCPDVYALDGTAQRVRFTLLRSPLMAHHDPFKPVVAGRPYADQGEHEFLFRFFGSGCTAEYLHRQAMMLHRRPVDATTTAGMSDRYHGAF